MFRKLNFFLAIPAIACSLAAFAQQKAPSADEVWKDLAAGNQRYVSGQPASKDLVAQRKALAKTQSPRVAVLSCSDSRVAPELAFDKGLGDLFVVRTAGESADPLAIGSLEYSVEHLHSTVILVMGHQSCGAVSAACGGGKVGSLNLEAVVKPIAASCTKVDAKKPETMDLAVRDHVHSVAQSLAKKSEILKHAMDEGKLSIIEAYYSLDTGEVTRLH
ncbi:carbonic anhydrase [Candidatus Koribacter versatilis Ellin345]|uniref:carbonic anhydrase n=1 Tax=Koribacter versatilis (strain Ellin345) TaxID=204669 RepID=Q1ILW0_KORVE|nr:carbonic anhydrase [Candidatus Koribacter versatilis]ABF42140.1 carbonic anhydrase [Candidatus Koribacter versatilis Ellin345]